jgi:tetratricopeptide (TPR) repeat protein
MFKCSIFYAFAVILSAQAPGGGRGGADEGTALDLAGKYSEAQKYYVQAIEAAPNQQAKMRAIRGMAMSYAFANDCKNTIKYENQLYDLYLEAKDFYNAGEMANEAARVCIEAGSFDEASKWYKIGHDAGLREPNISEARKDLWEFRTEHALARIAIRRGNVAEAQKHVAAAKAILDKGTNSEQAVFYPYLTGYVAFYSGEYKKALEELQKANQNDPFIMVLIGQTYEKLGDKAQAMEYYRKASGSRAHNPPNAFAHPFAIKKLSQN